MARSGSESDAGTLDCVGIAVALGAGHGKRVGGDEFAERSALAVGGDVEAFGLGDLQEIGSNTSQADGLRRSRTVIRGGHPLQGEFIDYKEKGCTDQKANKRAHKRIVARPETQFKRSPRQVASGNNISIFTLNLSFSLSRPNSPAEVLGRVFETVEGFPKAANSMTTWSHQCFIFAVE
jgi:hypothetical protein